MGETIREECIKTLQLHKEIDIANDLTFHQEADEFLVLIKRSDYKVVINSTKLPQKSLPYRCC